MYKRKFSLLANVIYLIISLFNPCFAQENEPSDQEIWEAFQELYQLLSHEEKLLLLNSAQMLERGDYDKSSLREEYELGNSTKIKTPKDTTLKNAVSSTIIPFTSVKWKTLIHNFGKIMDGKKVSHEFTFLNTSQDSMQIISVQTSCGCTVPSYDIEKIPPNGKGAVNVVFDSFRRKGNQKKLIFVKMNTSPDMHLLSLEGEVN